MQPIFIVLCSYFTPLLKISIRFGAAPTLYMIANLESAARMLRAERMLDADSFEGSKGLAGREDSDAVPSISAIDQFANMSSLNVHAADPKEIFETVSFYAKLSQSKALEPREISELAFKMGIKNNGTYDDIGSSSSSASANASDDGSNSNEEIGTITANSKSNSNEFDTLPEFSYLEDGKLADRFGVMQFFMRIFMDTTTNRVSRSYAIKPDKKAAIFGKILNETIEAYFIDRPALQRTADLDKFIFYLKNASKYQLKELGLNTETCLFSYRMDFATRVQEPDFDVKSPEVSQLLDFLNEKMRNDEIIVEYIKDDSRLLFNEVPSLSSPDAYLSFFSHPDRLEAYLTQVDNHPKSAMLMSKRVKNFEYGLEIAAYPTTLIVDLMDRRQYSELERITREHPDGIKGTLHANKEAIFRQAYQQLMMSSASSERRSIEYLIKAGFPFTGVQKKALMKRAVMAKNDFNLLRLLIEHQAINLSEYQEGRGITFYHSILIEGSRELKSFVGKNFLVDNPNDTIQFIPQAATAVCHHKDKEVPYWNCEEDLFDTRPAGSNLAPFMRIRKGWDSLTLAAVVGNNEIFMGLLNRNASASIYKKIEPFLSNQSIYKNLVAH